ncbi:hypothetical protein [Microlunatus ginsengisoli]|uniref:Uncharacterized protein n=1 Tax=Microlunatus ginsengisoli TaxID=363863 RepID=A0ABP6ZNH7_9ACTN
MPDQTFTGELTVLRRLARVRRGTVVAMFTEGERPLLRQPGELLLPDRNPLKHRISVMPISTEPVRLRVRVVDLLSLDGQHLDAIEMAVTVRLNPNEPDRILELAAKRGPQLGTYLNEQVREGIENTARAGVKMNTQAELQRQGLAATLKERWLPRSFVGLLQVVDFELIADEWARPVVVHRPHVSPPDPTRAPASRDHDPLPAPPADRAALHTDVRLLSTWRRRLPKSLPRGLAGAKVGDDGCVLAVVDDQPPAFEGRQLWEDFAAVFDDRHLALLLLRGDSYDEVVRSWFSQLGLPGRLQDRLDVDVTRGRVDVRLPADLADDLELGSHGRSWTGLDGAPVAALRRLLAPAADSGRKLTVGYQGDRPEQIGGDR